MLLIAVATLDACGAGTSREPTSPNTQGIPRDGAIRTATETPDAGMTASTPTGSVAIWKAPRWLPPSDAPASGDQFGWMIALGPTTVAVAAPGFADGDVHGAAFLYGWDGHDAGTLALEAVVVNTEAKKGDRWGEAVDVRDRRVVVGSLSRGFAILERRGDGAWAVDRTVAAPGASYEAFGGPLAFLNDDAVVVVGREGPGDQGHGRVLTYGDSRGELIEVTPAERVNYQRLTPDIIAAEDELLVQTEDATRLFTYKEGRLQRAEDLSLPPDERAMTGAWCGGTWWLSALKVHDDTYAGVVHPMQRGNDGWRPAGSVGPGRRIDLGGFGRAMACADDCLLVQTNTDNGLPSSAGAVHVVAMVGASSRVVASLHEVPAVEEDKFGEKMAAAGKWWFIGTPAPWRRADGHLAIYERTGAGDRCQHPKPILRFSLSARHGLEKVDAAVGEPPAGRRVN